MKAQSYKQQTGSWILDLDFRRKFSSLTKFEMSFKGKIATDEKALCCLRIIYPFGRRQF